MTRLKVTDVQNYQIMYEQCYLSRGSRKLYDSHGHPSWCGFLTQILEGGAQSWPLRMRATRKRVLLLSLLLLLSLYSAQKLRDEKSIRLGAGGRRYSAARAIGHNILSAGDGAYGVRPIASSRLIRFAKLQQRCCTKAAIMDVQYRPRRKRSVAIKIGTANTNIIIDTDYSIILY